NAFKQTDLAGALAAIAEIGYAGVELMADAPHFAPATMSDAELKRVAGAARDHGLAVSNINGFTGFWAGDTYHPTWIADDAEARALRVKHTVRCVELADMCGCRTVSLEPGGPTIGTGLTRDAALTRYADGLHEVLPIATKLGVTLAIEPEPGLLIESAAEYIRFKKRFFPNDPLVRMNCDLGHLFCVAEDPAETIRALPAEIAHVHLEDIAATRVHQHLTPGDGALDFPGIFAALAEIGYTGWITAELYPFENNAAGVARRCHEVIAPMLGEAVTMDA
ncbi:MAG: sugar phosphate isomerase/epimerase family protein, partial [Planctomycetota bacterium]